MLYIKSDHLAQRRDEMGYVLQIVLGMLALTAIFGVGVPMFITILLDISRAIFQ